MCQVNPDNGDKYSLGKVNTAQWYINKTADGKLMFTIFYTGGDSAGVPARYELTNQLQQEMKNWFPPQVNHGDIPNSRTNWTEVPISKFANLSIRELICV